MNMFILIISLFGAKEFTVDHIEFNSKETCEAAMEDMRSTFGGDDRHYFSCMKK